MVLSRNDKRKRKEGDLVDLMDPLSGANKRPKVHAQRKFAQGAATIFTPSTSTAKEKEKPKPQVYNDVIANKCPNTESFLTFLCFRGTSILPPTLNYFNLGSKKDKAESKNNGTKGASSSQSSTEKASSSKASQKPSAKAKTTTPAKKPNSVKVTNTVVSRKPKFNVPMHKVQALKKKLQTQRMVKPTIKSKFKGSTVIRTRSNTDQVVIKTINKLAPRILPKAEIKRIGLRSGGHSHHDKLLKGLPAKLKSGPLKKKKIIIKTKPRDSSQSNSESESQNSKNAASKSEKKVVRKVVVRQRVETKRVTRSFREEAPVTVNRRPTRKTKEAAAVYMEILGRKLVSPDLENDEDNVSVDSFPELPNVKKSTKEENEMKAKVRLSTRNAAKDAKSEIASLRLRRVNRNIVKETKQPVMVKNKRQLKLKRYCEIESDEESEWSDESDSETTDRGTTKPVTRNSSKDEKKVEEKKPDHNLRSGSKKSPVEKKEEPKPKKETVVKSTKTKEETKKPGPEKKKKVEKSQETSKKRKEDKEDEASEEETLGELLSRMNKKKDEKESKDEKEVKKEPVKVPKTTEKEKAVEKVVEKTEEQKKKEIVQPLFEMNDYKMSDDDESFVGFSKKSISKALSILSPEDGDLVMDVEPEPAPEETKSEVESIKQVQEEKKPVIIEVKKAQEVKVDKCAHETKVCVPNIINMSQSSSAWKEKLNMSNERIERWLCESSLAKETNKIEMEGESSFKFEVPELKKPGPRHHLSISTKIQHLVRPVNVTLSKLGEKNPRSLKLVKPVNFEAKALAKQNLLDLKNKMKPPETKIESPAPAKISKPSTASVETATEKVLEESKSDVDPKEKSSFEKEDSEKGSVTDKKSSQPRKLFQKKIKERKEATPSANAFSPENESSVYAFESDNEPMPVGTPFRRKTKSGETTPVKTDQDDKSSKDEDVKSSSESSCQVKTGKRNFELPKNFGMANMQVLPLEKLSTNWSNVNCSSSIAVQVNLDEPTEDSMEQDEDELERQKCNEISTQTDPNADNDNEDDTNGHLFYIPLQAVTRNGSNLGSGQQLIQGVAVKFDTEGPTGPNQRVLLKAKLVTKPPITVARCPPIGTVQPTTRPPPSAESEGTASTSVVLEAEASTSTTKTESVKSAPTPEKKKEKTKSPKAPRERKSAGENAKGKRLSMKAKLKAAEVLSSNKTSFPSKIANEEARLVEAPTFHPTEKDFQDPLEYIDKIRPIAEKFGICRVVPPPNFKPECKVSDDMRFTAYNQYVHKMLHRWGPNVKEMMAIKKYLATQSITLTQPPWIGGMEVDLPHLYQTVQSLGGLKEVIEKKKWQKVADGMKIPRSAQDRVTKLDDIYCKYLLPYDTLSPEEREKLFDEVETEWKKKESRSLERQDNQSTDEDEESDDGSDDIEECIVKGRNMPLNAFYRIARNTQRMWFGENQRSNSEVEGASAEEVEAAFWKHVSEKKRHVCVHNASIDSSGRGFGFSVAKNSPFARHPWNLKVLTNNAGSVLRALGPLMGVTVPTLHVGMLFSACCWYRDPHGLPWIEYLHTGAKKIWYGIPDEHNNSFRDALMKMVPRYCKNKTIWLPSDTAMVPPEMLVRNGVPLCHTVQEPGQFIIVFPKAFTSSICTGYVVSESVYFAQSVWLDTAEQVFQDIKDSCEPTVFSLEKLLISTINDSRSQLSILNQILPTVKSLWEREIKLRNELLDFGLTNKEKLPSPESGKRGKGKKIMEEEGDYECETCRANLSLSLVSNSQDESVYCLAHAMQLLKQKKSLLKDCTLMYTYDNSELLDLIDKLQERINAKSKKTNQMKK